MSPETIETLKPLIAGVATSLSRRFWKTAQVEYGDVEQECWEWALKHPGKIAEYLKHEDGEKLLRSSLKNAALDFCQREKAQRLGYEPADLYHWSKGDVDVSLSAMFDYDAWLEPPQSDGRSTKALAEGGNYIAALADLSRAYSQLPAEDRGLLRLYYADDLTQREIAEVEDVGQQAVSRRIDAAIRRLSDILGGPAPRQGAIHDTDKDGSCECGRWGGPGSRRAIGGAQARAITSTAYDGDGS